MPDGPFDYMFYRYLAFTYFDSELQRELLPRLQARLKLASMLTQELSALQTKASLAKKELEVIGLGSEDR